MLGCQHSYQGCLSKCHRVYDIPYIVHHTSSRHTSHMVHMYTYRTYRACHTLSTCPHNWFTCRASACHRLCTKVKGAFLNAVWHRQSRGTSQLSACASVAASLMQDRHLTRLHACATGTSRGRLGHGSASAPTVCSSSGHTYIHTDAADTQWLKDQLQYDDMQRPFNIWSP